jgi:hypothetical protein
MCVFFSGWLSCERLPATICHSIEADEKIEAQFLAGAYAVNF